MYFSIKSLESKIIYLLSYILTQELQYEEQNVPSNPRKIVTCILTPILIFCNLMMEDFFFTEESTGNFKTVKKINVYTSVKFNPYKHTLSEMPF